MLAGLAVFVYATGDQDVCTPFTYALCNRHVQSRYDTHKTCTLFLLPFHNIADHDKAAALAANVVSDLK